MGFGSQTGAAVVLVTGTLWIQCAGIALLIRWARASIEHGVGQLNSLRAAVLMIQFLTLIVVLHFLEILFWSAFYRWHCLPTWESSFYFSATSFSTVGYGDVVLPRISRLLGPIESITGVLMCGLSVSCLFAVATRLVERESDAHAKKYEKGLDRSSDAEVVSVS